MKTKDMIIIGLFAAVLAVLSQLEIPFQPVPFTLQTFGVMLIGLVLRPKKAFLAVLVWILLGVVGAPVFANFKSGLSVITGPTGGYIVGFLIGAPVISLLAGGNDAVKLIGTLIGGILVVYMIGVPWLMQSVGLDLAKALQVGAYPFIVFDALKGVLALITAKAMSRVPGLVRA